MERFELTKAFLSVACVYETCREGSSDVLYSVRGEVVATSPRYALVDAVRGTPMATLIANFIKTRYEVFANDALLATVVFPSVTLKKKLTLTMASGESFQADAGVMSGAFRCKAENGEVVLEIGRKLSLRDTSTIARTEAMPLTVALLTAVAVHSRFYDLL